MKLSKEKIIELANNKDLVFHWSRGDFEVLQPSLTTRRRREDQSILYQGVSLHVSDHIGKALSYCTLKDGVNYTTGIDLYKNDKTIVFCWPKDLDDAMKYLLSQTSYLYVFDRKNFFHKSQKKGLEGLWEYELIALKEQIPVAKYEIKWKQHFIQLTKTIGYTIVFENF